MFFIFGLTLPMTSLCRLLLQETDSNLSKIQDLLVECGIGFVSAANKNI